ncbi:MAG: hypothetical protein JXB46_06160 [Candidatus Eisenbacteria bacterium]|nr:hypothetical protein [Candidatus Eisenbacteria bacterium]
MVDRVLVDGRFASCDILHHVMADAPPCGAVVEVVIPLLSNLVLPRAYEDHDQVPLYAGSAGSIHLLLAKRGLEFRQRVAEGVLNGVAKSGPRDAQKETEQFLLLLRRTFMIPDLRIELHAIPLDASDLLVNNEGKVSLEYEQVQNSRWYELSRRVSASISSVINALFLTFRDPAVLRLSPEGPFRVTDDLPFAFFSLQHQIRSIVLEGSHHDPPRFDINPSPDLQDPTRGLIHLTFGDSEFRRFTNYLSCIDPSMPRWDLPSQYILLAEEHFAFGDMRLAVIEMDIAVGLWVREYLRGLSAFSQEQFDAITKETSTGQLIQTAQVCGGPAVLDRLLALERLHNLRNTILHRYQRSLGQNAMDVFRSARQAMWEFEKDGTA